MGPKSILRLMRILRPSLAFLFGAQVQVVFVGPKEIRKGTVNEICSQIADKGSLKWLILVVKSKMTSFAKKDLENFPFKVETIKVSFFVTYSLSINN